MTRTSSGGVAVLMAATLAACGGGDNGATGNYARLVDYQVTPTTVQAPATTSTTQPFKLIYDVDFKSDTYLPTYRVTTHILPLGQAIVSPGQLEGSIHTQFCGQAGYACGNPYEFTCGVQQGWLNAAQRHVRCDSNNLAMELNPGSYQFIAHVCELTTSAVTNCTTRTVTVTFQ